MTKRHDDRVWLIDQPPLNIDETDDPAEHFRAVNAAGRMVSAALMPACRVFRALEHRTAPPWCPNIRLPEFRLDRVAGDCVLIPSNLRER